MLQHLERGQRTEIDSLNGFVPRKVHGSVWTRLNRALTQLIKGREFITPTGEPQE